MAVGYPYASERWSIWLPRAMPTREYPADWGFMQPRSTRTGAASSRKSECLAAWRRSHESKALAMSPKRVTRHASKHAVNTAAMSLATIIGCGRRVTVSVRPRLDRASQAQIAVLFVRGLTDKKVAVRLGLAEGAVGSYLKTVSRQLRVKSRVALVTAMLADGPRRHSRRPSDAHERGYCGCRLGCANIHQRCSPK